LLASLLLFCFGFVLFDLLALYVLALCLGYPSLLFNSMVNNVRWYFARKALVLVVGRLSFVDNYSYTFHYLLGRIMAESWKKKTN
jgi:hypothetical protein